MATRGGGGWGDGDGDGDGDEDDGVVGVMGTVADELAGAGAAAASGALPAVLPDAVLVAPMRGTAVASTSQYDPVMGDPLFLQCPIHRLTRVNARK